MVERNVLLYIYYQQHHQAKRKADKKEKWKYQKKRNSTGIQNLKMSLPREKLTQIFRLFAFLPSSSVCCHVISWCTSLNYKR